MVTQKRISKFEINLIIKFFCICIIKNLNFILNSKNIKDEENLRLYILPGNTH